MTSRIRVRLFSRSAALLEMTLLIAGLTYVVEGATDRNVVTSDMAVLAFFFRLVMMLGRVSRLLSHGSAVVLMV